jgi:multidrug efflux pump subunit AcrA (membrane-fusion protein)
MILPATTQKSSWFKSALVIALLAIAGYFGWSYLSNRQQGAAAAKLQSNPPVPVTVAEVKKGDFPVYLNSLGSVAPYDTVTVRSRVDGQVLKVHFRQGQMVKEGDVLVEIDPRPYQAAYDQAAAKKAQDEANLKNAQLNLERYRSLAEKDFAYDTLTAFRPDGVQERGPWQHRAFIGYHRHRHHREAAADLGYLHRT